MKKFILIISLLISYQSLAVDATVKSTFTRVYQSSYMEKTYIPGPTIQGKNSYILSDKESYAERVLSKFGHVDSTANTPYSYLALTAHVDYNHGIIRQCVGFVKAAGGLPSTRDWREGNSNFAPGDIIAVFDDNGKYANDTNSHVAIYLSGSAESGLWVLDQNWEGTPTSQTGVIRKHFISPEGSLKQANSRFYRKVTY